MRKLSVLIRFGLVLGLLTGCSTKFIYQSPEMKPPESTGITFAYAKVEDERDDREIDAVYENEDPLQDIVRIIEEEVRSTGLFERVLLIPEDQIDNDAYLKENNVEFLMTSFLRKFKWTVPDYEEKLSFAFVAGFLGGIVGGVIYGCIPTDVYGDTVLDIAVKDMNSGGWLIDKEYVGHCNERKILFACDSPGTKATVGGIALKMVMEEFKADLAEAVRSKVGKVTRPRE